MILWRKKNSFDELVEIVKLMDFLSGDYQGSYPHPHTSVKYPINKQTLTIYLTTLDKEIEKIYGSQQNHYIAKEQIDDRKTQMLSGWVIRNCRYGNTNYKRQFRKAREAYEYFKRLE